MSGGGRTVRRGRMGQSAVVVTSPEEIRGLETDLEVMEERMQQLQHKKNEFEQQLSVLEPELHEMKNTYGKCSEELQVIGFIHYITISLLSNNWLLSTFFLNMY